MRAKRVPLAISRACVITSYSIHYTKLYDTGVSKDNLLKVYEAFSATGKPDKAGTIMYALGWTQHTA